MLHIFFLDSSAQQVASRSEKKVWPRDFLDDERAGASHTITNIYTVQKLAGGTDTLRQFLYRF